MSARQINRGNGLAAGTVAGTRTMTHMRALAIAGALWATGCAIEPQRSERPGGALPASFGDAGTNATPGSAPASTTAGTAATVSPRWWTLYGDETLTRLIDAALAGNADVRLAVAQLEEADAVLREVGANLYPQVDLGASSQRLRITPLGGTPVPGSIPLARNDRRLAASTSFELDFWGRLRNTQQAARAQALSSRYAADVVRLSLAGSVAQTWFGLRSADAQVTIARRALANRDETLAVVRSRAAGGLASDLDLRQAEAARADAVTQLIELQRQRTVLAHLLGTLSGQPGLAIVEGGLAHLPVPPAPPPGLPSSLVERRPDIQVAEQGLAGAEARVAVARAALFPTISLTGSFGGQSAALGDLLMPGARIWSLGYGLSLPIFDAGRIDARIEQAQARQRQVLAGYQKTVETAFREVADALDNLRAATESEDTLAARARASTEALRIAQRRYEAGYSAFLEVLDAQRTANDAELAQVRGRQSRLVYSVDLMKSLGGGWRATTAEAGATR